VPGDGALDVVLGNSLDPGAQWCENKNVDGICVSSVSFFLRLLIFFSPVLIDSLHMWALNSEESLCGLCSSNPFVYSPFSLGPKGKRSP
jgi:hypothetical protein